MTVVCLVLDLMRGHPLASLTSGTRQTGKSQNRMRTEKVKVNLVKGKTRSMTTLNGAVKELRKAQQPMKSPKSVSRKHSRMRQKRQQRVAAGVQSLLR